MVKKKVKKAPQESNVKGISREDAAIIFGIINTEEKNYADRMLYSVALQRSAKTPKQLMSVEIAQPHIDEDVYPELLDGLKGRASEDRKYTFDVDKIIHKNDNSTLLGLAVLHENEEAIDVLLKHGASPDHRFSDGCSVLGKALDLYMGFVKHARTESISRNTPVDIPFGQPKILERSERIVGKLIEYAGLDALEFPLNKSKKSVDTGITVTNGLAYGHAEAEGLFAKAIQQIKKRDGSAINLLNKKNRDGYSTLDVLMRRGNTKGADEVLSNLDDPLHQFELFEAANSHKNAGSLTIMVEDKKTQDWFKKRFPQVHDAAFTEIARIIEQSKEQEKIEEQRNKETDEYWEKELAKEQAESNKKDKGMAKEKNLSKSAKRKARSKAKKIQSKEIDKPAFEAVSETKVVKDAEQVKNSVIAPIDEKIKEIGGGDGNENKWTKVVKSASSAKRSKNIEPFDKEHDSEEAKARIIKPEDSNINEQTQEIDSHEKKFTSKLRANAKSFTPVSRTAVQALVSPDNSYDGYLRDKITGGCIYRDREGQAFESSVDAITSYEIGIRDYQNFKQQKSRLSYEKAEQVRQIVKSRLNGR